MLAQWPLRLVACPAAAKSNVPRQLSARKWRAALGRAALGRASASPPPANEVMAPEVSLPPLAVRSREVPAVPAGDREELRGATASRQLAERDHVVRPTKVPPPAPVQAVRLPISDLPHLQGLELGDQGQRLLQDRLVPGCRRQAGAAPPRVGRVTREPSGPQEVRETTRPAAHEVRSATTGLGSRARGPAGLPGPAVGGRPQHSGEKAQRQVGTGEARRLERRLLAKGRGASAALPGAGPHRWDTRSPSRLGPGALHALARARTTPRKYAGPEVSQKKGRH